MFSPVSNAIDVLRKASRKGQIDKELNDTIDSVAANLRLLENSLSADSEIFDKLVSTVRGPLRPLYRAFPTEALQLSAASFSFVFNQKIVNEITAGNKALKAYWEKVADSLLSGVLDFLEEQENAITFETVASAMYPTLCKICFSPAFAASITSGKIDLKVTAFTLLSDAAEHPANRIKLRDPEILGGRRIGFTLYASKEYLVLESLLCLVSRLISLPGEARAQRISFIRDVFMDPCPEGLGCANELVKTFSWPGKDDMDMLLSRSFDILARSNIFFPQPFGVDQINACEVVFPQKSQHEMFFIDYQCFLATIAQGDKYQTFRILFTTIHQIALSPRSDTGLTQISIKTTSPPELGPFPMELPMGQSLITVVDLNNKDIERFTNALHARGLNGTIRHTDSQKPPPRLSIGHTTQLTFGSDGNSLADVPSYKEKVTNIGWAMELDNTSDDSPEASEYPLEQSVRTSQISCALTSPQNTRAATPARLNFRDTFTSSSDSRPHLVSAAKAVVVSAPSVTLALTPTIASSNNPLAVPPTPSQIKIVQKSVFGYDGDELSEFSDDTDSLKALSQRQRRKGKISKPDVKASGNKRRTVIIGTKGRQVIDSDDDEVVVNRQKAFPSSAKGKAMRMDDSDEEILKTEEALPAMVIKRKQTKKPLVAAKAQHSSGRIESVSPISSPIDQSEGESDYEKPQISRCKSISVKSRKSVLKEGLSMRPKQRPTPPVQTKKRKRNQDDSGDMKTCDLVDDPPLAKRLRSKSLKENNLADLKPPTDSQVLKKPRSTITNTYGNKTKRGKASTASSNVDLDVDYEEVQSSAERENPPSPPRSRVSKTSRSVSAVSTRTRAAAMKNKKNEFLPTTKTKPTAARTTKAKVEPLKSLNKTKTPLASLEEGATIKQMDTNVSSKYFGLPQTSTPVNRDKEMAKLQATIDKKSIRKQKKESWESTNPSNAAHSEPDLYPTTPTQEPPDLLMNNIIIPDEHIKDVRNFDADASVPEISFFTDVSHKRGLGAYEVLGTKSDGSVKPATRVPKPTALSVVIVTPQVPEVEEKKSVEQPAMTVQESVMMPESQAEGSDIIREKRKSTTQFRRSNKIMDCVFSSNASESGEADSIQKVNVLASGPLQMDVPMIDLTQDESPKNTMPTRYPGSISPAPENIRPICLDQDIQKSIRAQHKVTFAPITREAPVSMNEFLEGKKNLFTKSRSKSTTGAYRQTSRPFLQDFLEEDVGEERRGSTTYDSNMQGIVNVLNEIQEVMIQKISGRFEGVESGARICQSKLLQDAVSDLQTMHATSASHFNRLIDLETEYATRGRRLADAYEENVGINREICQYVRQMIEEHDRTSLIKKMPKMLTSRRLPDILEQYRSGKRD